MRILVSYVVVMNVLTYHTHAAPKADYLRSAVQRLEGDHTHTMRGLDKFDPENTFGASIRSQSEKILGPSQEPADEVKFSEDRDLPVIELPPARKDKHGNRKIPQYVKSGFPTVFETPEDANPGLFPKIPGAEENYGMVYNKPETEAERTMHELWMARRRQEVKLLMRCLYMFYESTLDCQNVVFVGWTAALSCSYFFVSIFYTCLPLAHSPEQSI